MTFKDIREAVEQNIIKLFKIFYENPAIFLCERDVQAYLYSLLINDSFLKQISVHFKDDDLKKDSKTLLVHTEIPLELTKRKTGMYDISIWKPMKVVKGKDWETIIGIEIKFNRVYPAGKERFGILTDIKKVKENRRGYVLWLNWKYPISDDHLKKAMNLCKKYGNVKLYYLDVSSDPIKTNVKIS